MSKLANRWDERFLSWTKVKVVVEQKKRTGFNEDRIVFVCLFVCARQVCNGGILDIVNSVSFSPDGTKVASGSWDKQ